MSLPLPQPGTTFGINPMVMGTSLPLPQPGKPAGRRRVVIWFACKRSDGFVVSFVDECYTKDRKCTDVQDAKTYKRVDSHCTNFPKHDDVGGYWHFVLSRQ
jgi:hypothetical protein